MRQLLGTEEKEKVQGNKRVSALTHWDISERKTKTGGRLQLGLKLSSGDENIRSSWFPQSRRCLYFSLTHAVHINTQMRKHTHNIYNT